MDNPLRRIMLLRKTFKRRLKDLLFLCRRSQKVPIGVLDKLKMWRCGFLSESYLSYSLRYNDYRDYVSDHVRLKLAIKINGYYSVMLYDKLYFTRILASFKQYLPETYALIQDRRITFFDQGTSQSMEALVDLCRQKGTILLKPLAGQQGRGVIVIRSHNGKTNVNGQETSCQKLLAMVTGLDDYLVTEFIRQHEYASAIFPHTTNTIRILTLWDYQKNEPFIATAVHRFGNSRTYPVDSWTHGGISAMIDVDSGSMGRAAAKPVRGELVFTEEHPETKTQIEGVIVSNWAMVKSKILEMAASVPFIPYIGWDVIVTDEAFKVIEGNNCPDILMFQIHAPLLRDPRVRRFYQTRVAMLNEMELAGRQYKLPFKI